MDYIREYSNMGEANNEYDSDRLVFDYIEYSNVSLQSYLNVLCSGSLIKHFCHIILKSDKFFLMLTGGHDIQPINMALTNYVQVQLMNNAV